MERTEQQLFDELAALCSSPGYAHAIAYFCMRDSLVSYQGSLKAEDMRPLFREDRLIRTEISTLIGLLIKAPIDYSLADQAVLSEYVEKTEVLLAEIHRQIIGPFRLGDNSSGKGGNPFTVGTAMREPIFYGNESAYIFQYRDLAVKKYAADEAWLMANKGFSMVTAREVAKSIALVADAKFSQLGSQLKAMKREEWTCLPAFMFTAAEIAEVSGLERDVIGKVLSAFCVPPEERNRAFQSLSDFNMVNAQPLLRVDDKTFLLFQIYAIAESLYESPFYWMGADKKYSPTALQHRGHFTEAFCLERLRKVFGDRAVFPNVTISQRKGEDLGEIDVLVLFGGRAVIVQAKSKRLTLEARKGNDLMIKDDFKKSVRDSYDQAFECAELLTHPDSRLRDAEGRDIALPASFTKIYLFCVVADHYPALSFQTWQFLAPRSHAFIQPPFVMDIFLLDAMTEMLDSPLRLLDYLDRRAAYSGKLVTAQELTILSFHLKQNLWISDEHDLLWMGDDIAIDLDIAMAARREGMPGNPTPDGILTRISQTAIGTIIRQIEESAEPAMVDLGFLLLGLGENAVLRLSRVLEGIMRRTREDGKHHDVSWQFESGSSGMTIHCNLAAPSKSGPRLQRYCHARKYAQRAESWYGICMFPDGSLRFALALKGAWEQDDEMDRVAQSLSDKNTEAEIEKLISETKTS